jgi:hypothetical protein
VIGIISVPEETNWSRPRVQRNSDWIRLAYGICFPVWYQCNWSSVYSPNVCWDDMILGNTYSSHTRDGKLAQYFCRKIWRKETTRETQA